MPKKPTTRKKRKTTRERRWLRWLLLVLSIALISLSIYTLYLDQLIQKKFEGQRWSVPSRVYARPLELYPQRPLTVENLRSELELAGYQPSANGLEPGSYRHNAGRFIISTRAFRHWDGEEPAHSISVQISSGKIQQLNDAGSGRMLSLIRLKPVEIGTINPAHREDRILVRLAQLPPILPVALQAIEDRKFARHRGIDLQGIARASWVNLRAGRVVQGGSTLTQQLVKNFFLDSRRTFSRKFNEAIMALLLEWRFNKQDILEAYLNEVYLGQDGNRAIHGFGLAARFYFNKPVQELTLAESALLVAIVRGPTYYDPRRHPQRAIERRNQVIEILHRDGIIDPAQSAAALASPLSVTPRPNRGESRYPAFMGLVKQQLSQYYRDQDLRSEGLRIFTTLDPVVQQVTEQALIKQLKQLKQRQPERAELEVAVVVTRLGSAEVSAMVGAAKPQYQGFNRALEMRRPVGSLLKPAIYLTALTQPQHYTLASLIEDEEINLPQADGSIWSPANYDHTSHGKIPLITALAQSYNQAAVKLGMELGLRSVVDTLQQLGINDQIPPYPSVMLGSLELSPLTVAQMYQTLADRGYYTPLRAVREVLNAQHQPLQRYALETEKRFSPAAVYLLNQALRQALRQGTGKRIGAQLPPTLSLAGKTGTTNQLRDSWFAGFGSEYLGVVWLGNDDNLVTGLTGSSGALPVWAALMSQLEGNLEPLPAPPEITYEMVDGKSGLLADTGCESRFELPFIKGSEPQTSAPCRNSQGEGVLERLKGWFK